MRFPEFSGEWEKQKLSDFVERVTRKNKNNESKLPLTISAQYGLVDQITFFNKVIASADISGYYLLKKGEFAYNKSYSGDYTWGAVKRLDRYEQGALSTLYICFSPLKCVISDYLVHYFETKKWHREVSEIAVEGARNHGLLNIGVADYFNTKHFLPSKKEQKKIAAFLNLIEKRIALQTKIIEKYKSLIKGIVVEHYNKTHKTKVKIKDLGKSYSVMNMSKEDLSESGNECIIYGELFTTYDCVATDIVSRTEKSIQSSTISTGYDLLFPASTTVDAQSLIAPTAISQPNIILGGDMFGIVVDKKYNNEYLSYIFNYLYKNYLARYAQGSTIIHLHYNYIKNLDIELPDINTQNKLVLLLQNMQYKIHTEKKMLSMLEIQKAYLLSNLFI